MDGGTILLVEDNQDDVDLILRAFKQSHIGNDVVVARDGVEAIDYLFGTGAHAGRDTREQPTLVLLDLKLPRLSGHEVLGQIRADPRTTLVPVVVLTSSKEEEDVVRSYEGGANGYVRKPVKFEQFAETVRQLGLFWLVINQPPPAQG